MHKVLVVIVILAHDAQPQVIYAIGKDDISGLAYSRVPDSKCAVNNRLIAFGKHDPVRATTKGDFVAQKGLMCRGTAYRDDTANGIAALRFRYSILCLSLDLSDSDEWKRQEQQQGAEDSHRCKDPLTAGKNNAHGQVSFEIRHM